MSIDVAVTNVGKAPADNPLVKIAIPPGAKVQSVSGDGWVCQTQSDSIICLRPTLDAGGSAPIKVVLTPPLDKTSDVTTTATSKTFETNPTDNTTTTAEQNPLNIAVSGGGVSNCAAAPERVSLASPWPCSAYCSAAPCSSTAVALRPLVPDAARCLGEPASPACPASPSPTHHSALNIAPSAGKIPAARGQPSA